MSENNDALAEKRILDTNPRRFIIGGLLIILAFFGGLVVWSVFFPFQGAVIAPGTVKVEGERKTVQHLEGGIVDSILVLEGQKVEKGQVLIRLKSSQVEASVELILGRLRAKLAEAARLKAEAGMSSSIQWPKELVENKNVSEVNEVMNTEREIFESRRADLQGKTSLINSQISQVREKIKGAQEEFDAQKDIISDYQAELEAKSNLFEDNYVGKAEIFELRRNLSERRGRKGHLRQSVAEYQQKIEELKLKIVTLRDEYKEKAVTQLGEVKDEIFELRERLKPQLDAQNRLEVKAPISGEVLNLQVTSAGSGVIKPGEPLLDIVPRNSKLIIEARVMRDDITDVKKGQKTKVQLSAFNRRSTPPVPGEVTYVSGDMITEQGPQGEMSYYKAKVRVDEKALVQNQAYLSPGMPVVCYITTDKRTVIGYLLDPIFQNVDRALRE